MEVKPEAQDPPKNDVPEDGINEKDGSTLLGFGNEFYKKLVRGAPMLLPMLDSYGFKEKYPFFRKHWHTKKGFNEIQIGTHSLLVYLVFAVEFIIKLVLIGIYLTIILAIVAVILRGLQLPEYIMQLVRL